MDTDDATVVSESTVGTVQKVTQIHEGVNSTFVITTADTDYVVKFGTFDPSSVSIEPYILRFLRQHNIPVPTVYESGTHNGVPYFIMEFIEGTQLPYPSELSAKRLGDVSPIVGEFLAKMQNVEVDVGQIRRDGDVITTSGDTWKEFYRNKLEQFAHQSKRNYPSLGSKAMELVYWTSIPEIDEPVLCPIDLHTGNIFVDSNDDLEAAIDFERVYGGHPRWGYAVTVHTLTTNRDNDVRRHISDLFKQGYERIRKIPKYHPAFDLIAVMREMRAAHIWWEDPEQHRERLRNRLEQIETQLQEINDNSTR